MALLSHVFVYWIFSKEIRTVVSRHNAKSHNDPEENTYIKKPAGKHSGYRRPLRDCHSKYWQTVSWQGPQASHASIMESLHVECKVDVGYYEKENG